MKVKLAPRALYRARIIKTWWRDHRPGTEKLFEQELEHLTSKLRSMSSRSPLGTVHGISHGAAIRRVLLPKTEQHVYYSIDEANDIVIIHTIWGARRGRSPRL